MKEKQRKAAVSITSSHFDLFKWLKQTNTGVQYFLFRGIKLFGKVKQ